jgi:hypothetical protein
MSKSEKPSKNSKPLVDDYNSQIELINPEKKVSVYRNLHKDCLSVKQGTKVIFHTRKILLKNVKYRVNERIRQSVIENKRKEVHAFVDGFICNSSTFWLPKPPCFLEKVVYNPYTDSTFKYSQYGGECLVSDFCLLFMSEKKSSILAGFKLC